MEHNRADIKIGKKIFEIQHSEITIKNIKKRLETYGKENLIWFIDIGKIENMQWINHGKEEMTIILQEWTNCINTVYKLVEMKAGKIYLDAQHTDLLKVVSIQQENDQNHILCCLESLYKFLQTEIGVDVLDRQGAWFLYENRTKLDLQKNKMIKDRCHKLSQEEFEDLKNQWNQIQKMIGTCICCFHFFPKTKNCQIRCVECYNKHDRIYKCLDCNKQIDLKGDGFINNKFHYYCKQCRVKCSFCELGCVKQPFTKCWLCTQKQKIISNVNIQKTYNISYVNFKN